MSFGRLEAPVYTNKLLLELMSTVRGDKIKHNNNQHIRFFLSPFLVGSRNEDFCMSGVRVEVYLRYA